MTLSRAERRLLVKYNNKFPVELARVPENEWPEFQPTSLREVWRSRYHLVQVHDDPNGFTRLSVCHTTHDGDSWTPGMSWDELQEVKRQCGRGDVDAVELYPREADVVNVANFRHLWLLPEAPPYKW